MTRTECAVELYELICVKGRKVTKRNTAMFDNTSFNTLPEWMQEYWLHFADAFAADCHFSFDD